MYLLFYCMVIFVKIDENICKFTNTFVIIYSKKSHDFYIVLYYIILELIKMNLNLYLNVNIYKHICNIIHFMFFAFGSFKYKTE